MNRKIFDDNAGKAIQKAQRRRWVLIGFFLASFTLTILLVVYHQINSSKEAKIAQDYTNIEDIYNQENLIFQQTLEKQKNQANLNSEPEHAVSMSQFRDFVLKYPQNPYAWQAAVRSSTYYIMKNNYEDAKKTLEVVLPYVYKFELLQVKIRTTLAGIYANENNVTKAIEQLNIVENLPHNPMPNQSRLLKAQILMASSNNEEAKKVLNQIISSPNQVDSPFAQPDIFLHQAKLLLGKIGL